MDRRGQSLKDGLCTSNESCWRREGGVAGFRETCADELNREKMVRRNVCLLCVELLRTYCLIGCMVLLLAVPAGARAATGTLLPQGVGYPRLVRQIGRASC